MYAFATSIALRPLPEKDQLSQFLKLKSSSNNYFSTSPVLALVWKVRAVLDVMLTFLGGRYLSLQCKLLYWSVLWVTLS